jgi:hypothetical protein
VIAPVVAGHGGCLFEWDGTLQRLDLVDVERIATGALFVTYRSMPLGRASREDRAVTCERAFSERHPGSLWARRAPPDGDRRRDGRAQRPFLSMHSETVLSAATWNSRAHTNGTPSEAARQAAYPVGRDRHSNLIGAIETDTDPAIVNPRLAQLRAEREAVNRQLANIDAPDHLSPTNIDALLSALGGLASVLSDATATEKGSIYQDLRLTLVYHPADKTVVATAGLGSVLSRVGGGTRTLTPRAPALGEFRAVAAR